MIFSEAKTRVGASETPSIGWTSATRRGSTARTRSSAPATSSSSRSAPIASRNARLLGQPERRLTRREAVEDRPQFQQRVVADVRHRGVAGDAVGVQREAEHALLGAAQAVQAPAAVLEHAAAALVEEEVAADAVGVRAREPLRALGAAGLLVDDDDHEQRAARRPPARVRERGGGDDLGRGLRLHVERAAAPDEAVGKVARPRIVAPLRRRREHGVDVREQAQDGTRGLAAVQARDEVWALGGAAEQLAREAGGGENAGEVLLRGALVAGRVDGVEAEQPPQQRDGVVPELVAAAGTGRGC